MTLWAIVIIILVVAGPLAYLAIFGPRGKGRVGSDDRDLSPWGNPERDRVPGSRRRF